MQIPPATLGTAVTMARLHGVSPAGPEIERGPGLCETKPKTCAFRGA
jgi:hypothetical protein